MQPSSGTPEERGLIAWNAQHNVTEGTEGAVDQAKCYDLPVGMDFLREQKWAQYVPFLPTFDDKKQNSNPSV